MTAQGEREDESMDGQELLGGRDDVFCLRWGCDGTSLSLI